MKMRRIFLLIAAAATLAVGCSRSQKFTVEGSLRDIKFPKADSVRMESELLDKPIIAPVNDRAFVLQGKVKSPAIGKLYTVGTTRRNARFMILEKGTITFKDGIHNLLQGRVRLRNAPQRFHLRLHRPAQNPDRKVPEPGRQGSEAEGVRK